MNTKLVNSAAGVILAALGQDRTAAGIALALESAQLLMSPETAAGLPAMQKALLLALDRVTELETERHSTNESLSEAAEALRVQRDRLAELEAEVRLLNTQRGDVAQLIERERGEGEECVDIDDLVAALSLGSDETAAKCRCGEPDADPYACEADDCTGEFSELNPFGGGPVQGHDAKVSRTCTECGWKTSVWHVADGSAEEELHGHVTRAHGGTAPEVSR